MWNHLRFRYLWGREKLRTLLLFERPLKRFTGKLPSLLVIGCLSLALLCLGGVALANTALTPGAPLPTPTTAPNHQIKEFVNGLPDTAAHRQQQVAADPTPVCNIGDSGTQCAQHLTGTLGNAAQALYQIGVWVAIVVAILVIIWTTPQAIVGAASNNSKVVGQLIVRIVIIAALVLLAINSWSILQYFLGASSQSISPPPFPTIANPGP